MDNMTAQMAEQLKNNPAMLRSLMQSHDGQKLMQLLTKDDNGASLQQAVQSAVHGNATQMTEMVKRIMQSPDGAALVERINKAIQK